MNEIIGIIVDSAIAVHSVLGPGLLESTYRACLAYELRKRRLTVFEELGLPVIYEGQRLEIGYRIDLLVQDSVIVEIKSVEAIASIHRAQLLSYMKLSGKSLGLLLNFNVTLMKDGIVRCGMDKDFTTESTEDTENSGVNSVSSVLSVVKTFLKRQEQYVYLSRPPRRAGEIRIYDGRGAGAACCIA